jgi:hypothetical protein
VAFARETANVRDARDVTSELIAAYGHHLAQQIGSEKMKVAYAQNLLSSVNVVLETLRQDRTLRVSPAAFVGNRTNIRQTVPEGLSRAKVGAAARDLRQQSADRVAAVVELARDLGLRFREASLLDARAALKQANELGRINVTEGTKGGRGHSVDRWVPVSNRAKQTLEAAVQIQGNAENVIPEKSSFVEWRNQAYVTWQAVSERHDLSGFHDLRAAYACERYQQLTHTPAPIVSGHRTATKDSNREARATIAQELGHGRIDVVAAYIGSSK